MKKYYRVVLINTKTNERRMLYETFYSKKKAIESATRFCLIIGDAADFEVKQM